MSGKLSWGESRISDKGNGGRQKLEGTHQGEAGVKQGPPPSEGSALAKSGHPSLSGGEGGIRTLERRLAPTRFPVAPVRPLRHLSQLEPKPIPGGRPDRRRQLYPGPAPTVHRPWKPIVAGPRGFRVPRSETSRGASPCDYNGGGLSVFAEGVKPRRSMTPQSRWPLRNLTRPRSRHRTVSCR